MDDAVSSDRLVSEYLSQLHAAAWVLPADRRTALVDGARRRLYDEIGDDADAARTRAAIDSLGPPEDAVRREAETLGPTVPVPPRPLSVWGSREVAAVLLLAIGGSPCRSSGRWSGWRSRGCRTAGRPRSGWWPPCWRWCPSC